MTVFPEIFVWWFERNKILSDELEVPTIITRLACATKMSPFMGMGGSVGGSAAAQGIMMVIIN